MGKVRILEIKESVFADNDRQADQLRSRLKEKGVFLMNPYDSYMRKLITGNAGGNSFNGIVHDAATRLLKY